MPRHLSRRRDRGAHNRPGPRERVLQVIGRLATAGVDGVLLAGTELPLRLREGRDPGIPLLDTTRIRVRRALRELLS